MKGSSGSRGSKVVEYSHMFPCSKLKLDQLFLQWLSLPEAQLLVTSLIEDAKEGRPIRGPSSTPTPLSPSSATSIHPTPPLSPHKLRSPRSPLSPGRRTHSQSVLKERGPLNVIPQFYFPSGNPLPDDVKTTFSSKTDSLFAGSPNGLAIDKFMDVVRQVGDLPAILAFPLFEKLVQPGANTVYKDAFVKWWSDHSLIHAAPAKRMFEILRTDKDYLVYDDFKPLLNAILTNHPGLEFLAETLEFQNRYAETVIYRIFYHINRSGTGKMTLRELKKGDLLEALLVLEREDDINKVLKYFSYEHFYVVYCKFWELDTDHDFYIDRNDLLRYGGCALTYRIVDRIFLQAPRKFKSTCAGKMGYEDFVWFILSEEDKTTDTSLEYWFNCVDLDCDGVIRPQEMAWFYEEQAKRLESISSEPVLFEDVMCQLHDMLQPEVEGAYTMRDMRRMRQFSGLLFNILFNLHKFLAFENRDPFASRHQEQGEDGPLTEWDKWARLEYIRLAMEEDREDMQVEPTDDVFRGAMDQGMV